jgi:hypothetical protein
MLSRGMWLDGDGFLATAGLFALRSRASMPNFAVEGG